LTHFAPQLTGTVFAKKDFVLVETPYIWLVIFGGAGLLVLGLFLFAADWKFRKHHRRLDASRRKHQFSEAQRSEIHSPARFMPINDELLEKTPSLLSRQHETGQRMVEELQTGQRQLAGPRYENHELEEKIVNLIRQLHANERRLSESTREIQRIGQRNLNLQTEVTNLKQQLKASQARQEQLLNQLQTTKSIINEELLAKIDAISNKLAGSPKNVDELQTPQKGTKSGEPQFQGENQEPQAEIANVKHQLPTSEHRFSEAASENQHSAERHAPLPTELPEPIRHAGQSEVTPKGISQRVQEKLPLCDDTEKPVRPLGEQIDPLQKKAASLHSSLPARKLAARSSLERDRLAGIIAATAAIAIVGAVAIGFVRTSSDKDAANVRQGPSPSVADSGVATLESSTEPGIAEAVGERESKITEVVKKTPATSSAPRLRGTFKTVHPTGLFNGPSEESALIRTLAAGTKINVINSRDGWLEVRSMHGTSGFVRQEAAVKISENQR
jgi:hypothetical protein